MTSFEKSIYALIILAMTSLTGIVYQNLINRIITLEAQANEVRDKVTTGIADLKYLKEAVDRIERRQMAQTPSFKVRNGEVR